MTLPLFLLLSFPPVGRPSGFRLGLRLLPGEWEQQGESYDKASATVHA
ncbi:MAG TPA: hypothetical protein VFW03_13410 [Gemmatimonadaceae bacterium]|nr:hypothetical protein [Gemmatimonadaceae bacterium]